MSTDPARCDKVSVEMGGKLAGHSDHAELIITVDPVLQPDVAADTLLHEVLHCIFVATGLNNEMGAKREERLIQRLSPLLLDTLRRNPELVKFLLAE